MRFRMLVPLLATLLLPRLASAWHAEGHMAVALIAWDQMDPAQRQRVTAILEKHPHKDAYLAVDRPQEVAEPLWLFVKASTWPDWVRDPRGPGLNFASQSKIRTAFNKSSWHYVNLPLILANDTGKYDAVKIRKQVLEPEFDDAGQPRHALAALKLSLKTLAARETSDEDRAVSLCWVLHLIGDLHQPLHATALMGTFGSQSFTPPSGDRGGNRCAIRLTSTDPVPMELHSYWDGLLFATRPKLPQIESAVGDWFKSPQAARSRLPELSKKNFLDWAEESLALCKTDVYQDRGKFLQFTALTSSHSLDDLKKMDAPVITEAYKQKAAEVAKRRMIVAGYRTADQLKVALKK